MFTRYPRSVLRHELSHSAPVAPFKAGVKPARGNDAGLGPPGDAAHQEMRLLGAGGEVLAARLDGSRTPRRRLRWVSARELKERMCGVVHERKEAAEVCGTSVAHGSSSGGWDFPPARAGAPGRKLYRRGSVKFFRSFRSCSDDVIKAKEEYEADKYSKSAGESIQSRLWWWKQRGSEHEMVPFPLTVDKLQLLGALLKASGYRSAVAYMSAAKKGAPQVGLSVDGGVGVGVSRWKEGLREGHWAAKEVWGF